VKKKRVKKHLDLSNEVYIQKGETSARSKKGNKSDRKHETPVSKLTKELDRQREKKMKEQIRIYT
jgi:hypothetical protein